MFAMTTETTGRVSAVEYLLSGDCIGFFGFCRERPEATGMQINKHELCNINDQVNVDTHMQPWART